MTLSAQARMNLDREHELTGIEQAVVSETLRVLSDIAAGACVRLANDDRAAELEAALIQYLLDSRNP